MNTRKNGGYLMATNEQMKLEFSLFKDAWNFFKKYYDVQNLASFWESAIEEAAAINERYHCELSKDLLMTIICELERRGNKHEAI